MCKKSNALKTSPEYQRQFISGITGEETTPTALAFSSFFSSTSSAVVPPKKGFHVRKNPEKSSEREREKLCQKQGKPLQKWVRFEPEQLLAMRAIFSGIIY